jgi:ATP synthase protein I
MDMEKIGGYAFLAGILIAVLAAFIQMPEVPLLLAILGLIVGLLNITDKEVQKFLLAAIALAMSSASLSPLALTPALGPYITILLTVFSNIAVFVAPAAFVVALKTVYTIANK